MWQRNHLASPPETLRIFITWKRNRDTENRNGQRKGGEVRLGLKGSLQYIQTHYVL